MKRLIIIILIVLAAAPVQTYAQEPTPEGPDIPYDIQPVEYESGQTNSVATSLAGMMTSIPFINRLGSIVVTTWKMLDEFAGGGVLAYFAIFIGGLWVIRYLSNFVFEKNVSGNIKSVEKDIDETTGKRRRRSKNYY